MGKVIILAGAPDAASLDWSGLVDDTDSGSTDSGATKSKGVAVWHHDENSTHDLTPDRPRWRSVPLRAAREIQSGNFQGGAGEEASLELDESEQVQVQVQQEWAGRASHGRAEFATFTASGYTQSQSQSQSQSQPRDWSVSSADVPSLSIQIPGALPPPCPGPRGQQHPTPTPSFMLSGETTASQELIEHSLAVHDALPSSLPDPSGFSRGVTHGPGEGGAQREAQVQRYIPASFGTSFTTSFDDTTSSSGTTGSFAAGLARAPPPLPSAVPRWQPLTHLVDIPSADALANLARRTVTVNIVAAVVAASAPRAVNVRQNANNGSRRTTTCLVELVVGDDTRSGFGITIWLDNAAHPSLASLLSTLHPQDIVLVQNLALNTFNGKVYGSTLRRNLTQMHVLHRQRRSTDEQAARDGAEGVFTTVHLSISNAVVAANTAQASGPQPGANQTQQAMAPGWRLAAKASRVRAWALQYVFAGNKNHSLGGPTAAGNIWVQPPAETQDSQ